MDFLRKVEQIGKTDESVVIYFVSGDFCRDYDDLIDSLKDDMNQGIKQVFLNLESVSYLSSSGIGTLLHLYKEVLQHKGNLGLLGLRPSLEKIFASLNITKIIKSYKSVDEAMGVYA